MRMPFGKHKGEELHTIPDSYLWWVLENAESASPLLLAAIRRHLGLDDEPQPSRHSQTPPPANAVSKQEVESALSSVVRQLSLKYHPDRGGTVAQMQVVNEVAELLRSALSRVAETK